jgi:hypothetical protein
MQVAAAVLVQRVHPVRIIHQEPAVQDNHR